MHGLDGLAEDLKWFAIYSGLALAGVFVLVLIYLGFKATRKIPMDLSIGFLKWGGKLLLIYLGSLVATYLVTTFVLDGYDTHFMNKFILFGGIGLLFTWAYSFFLPVHLSNEKYSSFCVFFLLLTTPIIALINIIEKIEG